MTTRPKPPTLGRDQQTLLVAVVVVVQAVAAMFFMADALGDLSEAGLTRHVVIEALVAFALVAGVVLGAWHLRILLAQAERREQALIVARGALSDHINTCFREWGLTAAESDVALFALKGCDAAQIAELRGAAPETVRAQLSQIYAKAGVSSQAGLVSLFLDELL